MILEQLLPAETALKIVIYLLGIFTVLSIFVIAFTIALRVYHIIQNQRELRLKERFSTLFFQYLDNPDDPDVLSKLKAIRDKGAFFNFVLEYLNILKGEDFKSIMELIHIMGIPEELQRMLERRDRWQRAYAAFFLGYLKFKPALPQLLAAFRDRFFLVSFYAARSVIQIGDPHYYRDTLVHLFRIPHISSYQRMEALIELDEEGLAVARELFREWEELREEVIKLFVDLFAYKKYLPAAEDILLKLLSARNRELRISCVRALGLLNYTEAIPILREMTRDQDWVVRSQVLRALGRIGDIGSMPEFLAAMEEDNFWVRYNAGLALLDLGAVGIEQLRRIQQDENHPAHEIAEQILVENKAMAA
ncbi:MAG: HEAT repeat domain-containing protein [Calditrichaeota bacterium]|nr:MAG: HEAT repeat domain-containing protein [Calditrichota bacterium]